MAESNRHLGEHLKPLSELSHYTIEKGDPDPRGYTVVANDGAVVGEVEDLIVNTDAMKVEYLVVQPNSDTAAGGEGTNAVLLAVRDVDVRSDSRRVMASRFTGTEAAYTRTSAYERASAGEHDRTRLTRTEEELEIGKREVSRGEARVGKHVKTQHVSEPITRRREEVVIERRPVEAGARPDAATIGDEEIRVPLMEEEVVVEKRPVVKEELVVGKRVVEERDTVHAELRREEFDIDQNRDTSSAGRTTRRDH